MGDLTVYDNFEEMKEATIGDGYPAFSTNMLAEVAQVLDQPYEVQLDI